MKKISLILLMFLTLGALNSRLYAQVEADSGFMNTFNQVVLTVDKNKLGLHDPIDVLRGQVVGLSFTKKGSDPTISNSAIIRGNSSYYSPGILYVIDGVYDADPSMLLPDDIESFEIIRDAASLARFGSQAMAGAIIITTKTYKGDKKLSVEFSSFLTLSSISKKINVLSSDEFRSSVAKYNYPEFEDGGADTDWQDEIFRSPLSQVYKLGISGKRNDTHYSMSVTHLINPGIVRGTSRNNTALNVNVRKTALDNRLKLYGKVLLSYSDADLLSMSENMFGQNEVFYNTLVANPTDPVYNSDGKSFYRTTRNFKYNHPLKIIEHTSNKRNTANANINTGGEYVIGNRVSVDFNIGFLYQDNNTKLDQSAEALGPLFAESSDENEKRTDLNMQMGVNYKETFGNSNHLRLRGGLSNRWCTGHRENEHEQLYHFSTGDIKLIRNFINFTGLLEYDFDQRYFFSTLVNYELKYHKSGGSNSVNENDFTSRNNIFPAIIAGWKLNNEDFMKNINLISNLTIKGSYGIIGNEYADNVLYSILDSKGTELEKLKELQMGIDLGLWKNRVNGSVTFYMRNNKNGITNFFYPWTQWVPAETYTNGTWYRNKGIEIIIGATPVLKNNFEWNTTLTYSANRDEIVSTNADFPFVEKGLPTGAYNLHVWNYTQLTRPGNPPTVFWLPVLTGYNEEGYPLFVSKDGGQTRFQTEAQRKDFGPIAPQLELGWMNNFKLSGNINLSVTMSYAGGFSIFNATRGTLATGNFWFPQFNVNEEALSRAKYLYIYDPTSNVFLEDASYLRLNDITVSYTIKPLNSKLGESLNLYLSAANLLTLTDYSGYDPAGYSDGVDYFNVYPLARSFTFGVRLKI